MLSLSRRYVYMLVASGELPAVKLGAAIRITRDALDQFIADKETNASEEIHPHGISTRSR
jgi:excisionase family DNA binding protein